jgi:GNAT superfamily N-acetyltransferase
MTQVVIRPIRADDEAHWRRLWTGYLEFYESSVPEEVYATYFSRLMGNDPQDFNGFLALLDDKPIGLVHYLFHRHGWKIENTCYLQDLFVDPQVRRSGAGKVLIEAVYQAAQAAGVTSVYWNTQDFNDTARRLYDKVATLTPFLKYTWP